MVDLIAFPPQDGPGVSAVTRTLARAGASDRALRETEHPPGWFASRRRDALLGAACMVVALTVALIGGTHPKYAIGVLLGAVLVGAVALRPYVGVLVLVTLVPVSSGFATGFPVGHVRISEALIGLVAVTVLVTARRSDAVGFGFVDWALLAYGVGWAAFGAIAAMQLRETLSLDQWGTIFGQLQFFLIYRAVRTGVRSGTERRGAVVALVASATLVALVTILQELHAPGIRSLLAHVTGGLTAGSATTGAGFRATGPFDNWAALAGFLLPVVLVALAVAVSGLVSAHRNLLWGAIALCTIGLVLSLEQNAIVCMLAGGLFVLARLDHDGRRVRWAIAAIAAAAVVAIPLLIRRSLHEIGGGAGTGRVWWVPQTLSFRWSIWVHQYLPAIWARPLSGYGVVIPPMIHWPWPESQYISYLLEGGAPMLLLFALVAVATLRSAQSAARSAHPLDRALGTGCLVALISMLAMNLMWPFLSNGGMPQVLWPLLALAAVPSPVSVWRSPSLRAQLVAPRPHAWGVAPPGARPAPSAAT